MDEQGKQPATVAPRLSVASSPHLHDPKSTTRRMMLELLIGLVPLVVAAMVFYGYYVVWQLALCIGGCMATEAVFTAARKRPRSLWDLSAVVTGAILALSLPWNTPWYISLIGAVVAIAIGKMAFGGLGMNLFNPAMVGRAFVMLTFAWAVGAGGYVRDVDRNPAGGVMQSVNASIGGESTVDAVTRATPLTAAKEGGARIPTSSILVSSVYSSLGERGIFVLIGAAFLIFRGTIAWQIPAAAVAAVVAIAGLGQLTGVSEGLTVTQHIFGGAFLFGALFIVTDPTTSPITPAGRWIFGALFGAVVLLLRELSNYPEGVMFSVLLVNALVPLINRWTIPRPFGGAVPKRA